MVDTKKQQYQRQNAWVKDHTDRINFTMPKGMKGQIIESAELVGMKPAAFIRAAITDKIETVNALKSSGQLKQDQKTEK